MSYVSRPTSSFCQVRICLSLEELKREMAEMQRRFVEQAGVLDLSQGRVAVRIAPRSRVASVCKPKEMVTKDFLEFEEDDGVLHVKEL